MITKTTYRISVVICDDRQLVRAGMRAALEVERDIVVVAESVDHASMEQALRLHRPDVAVVGHPPPDPATQSSRPEVAAAPAVVLLADSLDPDELSKLVTSDIRGVVSRTDPPNDLVRAVRAAADGKIFLSPVYGGSLVQMIRAHVPASYSDHSALTDPLTSREHEVFELVVKGMSNRDISRHLGVSEKTVKYHVSNVLIKSGFRTRTELIACVANTPAGPGARGPHPGPWSSGNRRNI